MISRKENLLVRPWQQKKFENHRRKVQSALPVIDSSPPVFRSHVAIKLKKQERENERCRNIERENVLLLQKMNYIMKTSRIDNSWKAPQPNFLNKVAIVDLGSLKFQDSHGLFDKSDTQKSQGSKCYACTLARATNTQLPDDGIAWEPARGHITRIRSKSVPARQPAKQLTTINEQLPLRKQNSSKIVKKHVPITNGIINLNDSSKKLSAKEHQSITLTRGCLKLCVHFPSDSVVKFQKGNIEKILVKSVCHCKNSPAMIY